MEKKISSKTCKIKYIYFIHIYLIFTLMQRVDNISKKKLRLVKDESLQVDNELSSKRFEL